MCGVWQGHASPSTPDLVFASKGLVAGPLDRIVQQRDIPVYYDYLIIPFHLGMRSRPAQPMATAMHPSRLDALRVRHLRLLDLIAGLGSLTAAAEQLGISQPTATKLLQDMERVLRCSLVDRNRRGGELTESGRRALERIRLAVHAIDQVPDAVTVIPHYPTTRVGLLPVAGISLLPQTIKNLMTRGRLPRLQLHEGAVGKLTELLVDGQLDCIIGRLEPNGGHSVAGLEITQLNNDPYELACSAQNPISRRRAVNLRDLCDQPWILPPRESHTRQAFETAFSSQGLPAPTPIIESPFFYASFAVVDGNPQFLTIAPRSSISRHAGPERIRAVKLSTPFPDDHMVFITRPDLMEMHALALLRDSVREVAANFSIHR